MREPNTADTRKARLAQALRENLKRRKSQIRARQVLDTTPDATPETAPEDSAASAPDSPAPASEKGPVEG